VAGVLTLELYPAEVRARLTTADMTQQSEEDKTDIHIGTPGGPHSGGGVAIVVSGTCGGRMAHEPILGRTPASGASAEARSRGFAAAPGLEKRRSPCNSVLGLIDAVGFART